MAILNSSTVDTGQLLKRTVVAIVLALLVNLVLLTLVLTLDLVGEYQSLGYGPVTIFSSVGVVGGAVVYTLLDRVVNNGDGLFTRIAFVVLLLSFIPNIAIFQTEAAATIGVVSVLMLMHIPPALAAILSLTGRLNAVSG